MANQLKAPGISPSGEPTTFQGCLERVNPSAGSLKNLAEQEDKGPFMMLNFLRFRPRGDSTIYSLYGKEAAPEVKKVGSFVGYYGKVLTDLPLSFGFDNSWDGVVIPVYHRRRSYLDLQRSSAYQLAIPYRSAGTSRRMLYPLADCPNQFSEAATIAELDVNRQPLAIGNGEVAVVELLRHCASGEKKDFEQYINTLERLLRSVSASIVLSLATEEPVLSEELWGHCLLMRFPSVAALNRLYCSNAWKEFQADHINNFDGRLRVASHAVVLPG